jgi:proteasome assembly chaperone (PAC2) family protein
MQIPGIIGEDVPPLKDPIMIAGFDGWGNALNVSKAMAAYLIRNLDAVAFARLDPDTYYRFDEHRPVVTINDGQFRSILPPGGAFFAARTATGQRDIIVLEAVEPDLNWYTFTDAVLKLCRQANVKTLFTLGSLYDNLLHTERLVSGVSNNPDLAARLRDSGIQPISYQGPSAIHSVFLAEAGKHGIKNISLWCHCPYYLQGTTHFGQLLRLARLLTELGGFDLDMADLEKGWKKFKDQIDELIENNSELQQVVNDLHKRKTKGSIADLKNSLKPDEKVIRLQDFFDFGGTPPETSAD